jgi:hypothetical protein
MQGRYARPAEQTTRATERTPGPVENPENRCDIHSGPQDRSVKSSLTYQNPLIPN